ncbi:MAG: SAM-dependent methyltransferase [Elusimicrobiales bacterium]|jgi:precorrin-2 methylase|nr:SAM-dependent methyltransferase [Elusimicrobiales bacterium]
MKKELLICSFGLKPAHVTAETLSELKRCDAAYTHCLDEATAAFLRPFCRELHFLRDLTPAKIAGRLISRLSRGGRIAFVTYGNPLFLNVTTRRVASRVGAAGADVRVLEAVSSLDALVNALDLNRFSVGGLRLVDLSACDCLPEITPGMDTLFFMASDLNLPAYARARQRFLAALLAAYPPGHRAVLADCDNFRQGRLLESSVKKLGSDIRKAGVATTLFVPGLPAAPAKKKKPSA